MQNSSKDISIVLATYNGSKYLQEQLDSIIQQTVQPTEIIIQDDCSTDETIIIIQKYFSQLPIQLFINSENIGYIRNFELALSKASGTFIAICDQDDIWEVNKLELLFNGIKGNSLIYSNSLLIDADGKSLKKTLSEKLKNRFISTHSPLAFVYDNCVSAHALLFHHSLLSQLLPFPKNLYFDAWIAANAASNNGINYLDRELVYYRQHTSNTLSRTHKPSLSFKEKTIQKAAKKLQEHSSRILIISDVLSIATLEPYERDLLKKLQLEHSLFPKQWFNFRLLLLLIKNRSTLFAITKRNPFILAFKKSIGFKLYRFCPFL